MLTEFGVALIVSFKFWLKGYDTEIQIYQFSVSSRHNMNVWLFLI